MVRQQQLSLFWCTNSLLFQLFSRWVYEKPYTHCLCFHSFSQYLKRNINNLLWAFSNSQNALWVNIFGNALNLVLHIHGIKKCIKNNDKLVLEMLKKSVTLRIQPVMYNVQIVHMCVWGGGSCPSILTDTKILMIIHNSYSYRCKLLWKQCNTQTHFF